MPSSGDCVPGLCRHPAPDGAAPDQAALSMAFMKPVASTSQATFTFTPKGSLTRVMWRLLGSGLEKGLAGVKAAAEKQVRQFY
jgi:hypothetical protein